VPALALGVTLALLQGCSASRIEEGVFRSPKGYSVRLPAGGWQVRPDSAADLELRREAGAGGMLADASCGGREPDRPLAVLSRHLTFGLAPRRTIESDTRMVAGRPARHTVVRGVLDGTEVEVEAVVWTEQGCVHDFLYAAPVEQFEAGRADFRGLVDSFARTAR
jgi:hypothetical protein